VSLQRHGLAILETSASFTQRLPPARWQSRKGEMRPRAKKILAPICSLEGRTLVLILGADDPPAGVLGHRACLVRPRAEGPVPSFPTIVELEWISCQRRSNTPCGQKNRARMLNSGKPRRCLTHLAFDEEFARERVAILLGQRRRNLRLTILIIVVALGAVVAVRPRSGLPRSAKSCPIPAPKSAACCRPISVSVSLSRLRVVS
jgi:hypothetical protein